MNLDDEEYDWNPFDVTVGTTECARCGQEADILGDGSISCPICGWFYRK